jgi:hypothetical protein
MMKKSKQLIPRHIAEPLGKLNGLSDSVANLLQINWEAHTLWVSIKKNRLLIMTDDSSLATQLRFQQTLIEQHLNQKLLIKLKRVKIKVIAAKSQHYEATRQKCFRISPQAANILSSMAQGIDDEALRACLQKFGK